MVETRGGSRMIDLPHSTTASTISSPSVTKVVLRIFAIPTTFSKAASISGFTLQAAECNIRR